MLIQNGGENWRQLRNGPVSTIGAWILAGFLALIVIFHFTAGPQKPDRPPSGDRMPRWSLGDRIIHWYTAVLFIVLAITGLSLLFGRAVLIPVLGLEGFAAYAGIAKSLHNYLGPFFLVGVLAEVLFWFRFNGFTRDDWRWLLRFGGMLGGGHAHAGRTNGGEKVWFWFIATIGLIGVGASGLVMNFPNFDQSRETMQLANLIHASLAILWVGIALGHIYVGTLGTPGTLDGMVKGHVSKEWMQTHHDRWHDQLEREGKVASAAELESRQKHVEPRAGEI
jgi:formate dehydrogenase subunit gamma